MVGVLFLTKLFLKRSSTMKKIICGLLCLAASSPLMAQSASQQAPVSDAQAAGNQVWQPDPGISLAATVYGDSLGDSTRQDSLVRYYLLRNLRKDKPLMLDVPTAFPLIGPGQPSPIALSSDGRPLTGLQIPPGKMLLLRASAALPRPGAYSGVFQLAYHYGAQDSTGFQGLLNLPIKATRSARSVQKGKPFFRIEPIGILVQAGGCTTSVRFVVRDTSGKGGQMQIPLVLLNQVRGDTSLQARYLQSSLALEQGEQVIPLPVPTLTFAPNEAKRIRVTFTGLALAEQYTGRVLLQGDSFYEVSQPFSIRLRRTLLFAVLVIALGLFLAAFARWLYAVLSPRLKQRLVLLDVQSRFQAVATDVGGLNDMEATTVQRILDFVGDALHAVQDKPMADTDLSALLSNLEARRGLLYPVIALRQALDAAEQPANPLYATVQTTHLDFLRVRPTRNCAHSCWPASRPPAPLWPRPWRTMREFCLKPSSLASAKRFPCWPNRAMKISRRR
jgi:hypothetical protein